MKNPFKYGSRVSGGAFFDRERIMHDMLGVIDGGNNIVLYGPRRFFWKMFLPRIQRARGF